MRHINPFEIQRFHSLTDLIVTIDKTVQWYEWMLAEYDHQLGIIMREVKATSGDLLKKLSLKKTSKATKKKKKSKKKSNDLPEHWFTFNNIQFSTLQVSKAEIFFAIKDMIEKNLIALQQSKQTLEELAKKGMKADLDFLVFFEEGVPIKVFIEDTEKAKTTPLEFTLVSSDPDSEESILIPDTAESDIDDADELEETQVLQVAV